jgi:hypothetical protein
MRPSPSPSLYRFGHKGQDKDLIRVYMSERSSTVFRSLASVEASLSSDLRDIILCPDLNGDLRRAESSTRTQIMIPHHLEPTAP